jgi:alkylhydroperoxidase family enzyme
MPSAEAWLEAFAARLGVPAPTDEERTALLGLASTAAHDSERRAAPIACWLAARAGLSPQQAQELALDLSVPPPA